MSRFISQYFTYFTCFTCLPNGSIIAHVSQYLPCFTTLLKIFSEIVLCALLQADFTEMAALRKFLFAAAMLPEHTPTATMLTAVSRSQSQKIAYLLQVNL